MAGIGLFLLILAACYTVFIAPLLQKEEWIYKEETVERGTLKVGVTESGSLEYNTKSIEYDLDLDVSDDDDDDSDDDDDDTVQKYLKIEEIYVASGQRVTEGEELLKFTEDSVVAVRALFRISFFCFFVRDFSLSKCGLFNFMTVTGLPAVHLHFP